MPDNPDGQWKALHSANACTRLLGIALDDARCDVTQQLDRRVVVELVDLEDDRAALLEGLRDISRPRRYQMRAIRAAQSECETPFLVPDIVDHKKRSSIGEELADVYREVGGRRQIGELGLAGAERDRPARQL